MPPVCVDSRRSEHEARKKSRGDHCGSEREHERVKESTNVSGRSSSTTKSRERTNADLSLELGELLLVHDD